MSLQTQQHPLTYEGLMASIYESNRYLTEKFAETDRILSEKQAETDRLIKETGQQMKETDQRIARLEKSIDRTNRQIGGITNSNGEFCEEYFINAYKENPVFMGERFDRVLPNLRPDPVVINDEYDLVLRNGKTVVLIEMKYKANVDDVGRMFRKLETYRANYPMFKEYKVYLCLASFRFSDIVRARAEEEGVVLIQQRGEVIEVISENLKTW